MLSEQTKNLAFDNEFSGSTRNVIMSVLLGRADAGATLNPQLDREPEEIRNQIRTILETKVIPSHPLSVHPRVPVEVRDRVRKAVLAIAETPEGAELLQGVRMPAPITADYDKDYRTLEEVQVKQLTDWGN